MSSDCLLNPSLNDYQTALNQASQFTDQKITLTDATTAILSKALNLSVWTYDFHFDVIRVAVWR